MGRFATGLTGSMLALCLALQPVTASAETVPATNPNTTILVRLRSTTAATMEARTPTAKAINTATSASRFDMARAYPLRVCSVIARSR